MKILISGSSGLIGSALVSFFESQHHQVYKLVRKESDLSPHEIAWDPEFGLSRLSLLEGFDAVIHLAGETIQGFWTEDKKERIRNSRVISTRMLSKNLSQLTQPPSIFICASAIGYYGNRGDELLTEQSEQGEGFLSSVCQEWEEATRAASQNGIRTVNMRTGFVLSKKGGGFPPMLTVFKWGAGGKIGSGEQYMSWIDLDDLVNIFDFVIQKGQLAGPVNAVSPHPVKNIEWTETLGKELHRPTFLSVPTFMIDWIAGEWGKEVLLSSTRVIPQKLETAGFQFRYPELSQAFKHVIEQ